MDVNEVLAAIDEETIKSSIGTKQEKTIHQFLKYYISPNSEFHEIQIDKNIIDVFINNQIYEIQTQSFNALRTKLSNLLPKYNVTIVYPVCVNKILYQVNTDGEVIVRKSPKKNHPLIIGEELYKIKDFLKNENLHFKIILLNVNEYQKPRFNRYKQRRLSSIDRIPTAIIKEYNITKPSDWKMLIPDINNFTVKDLIKQTRLSNKQAGTLVNVLKHLEVISIVGKKRNAYIYQVN